MAKKTLRDGQPEDPPVRPQLYVSVIIVMAMLVLMYMGLWEWVLVLFIGLLVGNGLSWFGK
jgi:hypothetical protein